MEQSRADQCVYRKIVEGVVKMILVVHVDDIVVSGEKETCEELHHTWYTKRKFPDRKSRGVEMVPGVRCEARLARKGEV